MKKPVTLGLVMFGLFATNVRAETKHCHTIEDCQKLKAEVEDDLAELLRNVLTEIIETGVTQYKAKEICQDKKMRGPTARELALISQSRGAKGIRETSYPNASKNDPRVKAEISQMKEAGYIAFYKRNNANTESVVDFYFNYQGYQRPEGNPGNYWVWSSSINPDDSNIAYGWSDYTGAFVTVHPSVDYDNAVRCVRTR